MSNYILILPEILLAIMLASAFGILFLTVLKIVRQTGLFQGRAAIVLSFLISAFAVAGYAQLLIMPNNMIGAISEKSIAVNFSMLPAMVLSGLIGLLGLFAIVVTTAISNKDEMSTEKPIQSSMKPSKSPRRTKKEKSEEKNVKETPMLTGSES